MDEESERDNGSGSNESLPDHRIAKRYPRPGISAEKIVQQYEATVFLAALTVYIQERSMTMRQPSDGGLSTVCGSHFPRFHLSTRGSIGSESEQLRWYLHGHHATVGSKSIFKYTENPV